MTIGERYAIICDNISSACAECGRKTEDIRLIAVTKTRTAEEINEAISLGIKDIGENRVQELMSKYDALVSSASVHLIGQLQTNKVKYIIDKVTLVHSLDRIALAEQLDKEAQKKRKTPIDVLIEINIGAEESKSGISPHNLTDFLDNLTNFMYINPIGLMTVAPADADELAQNAYFEQMHELLIKGQSILGAKFKELSMGMSRDYIPAIKQGATMVRLGTALFGERNYNLQKEV